MRYKIFRYFSAKLVNILCQIFVQQKQFFTQQRLSPEENKKKTKQTKKKPQKINTFKINYK